LKKVVALSLLTILFTSQVGYYFIYTIHQYIIKEEMEREMLKKIPESSLEVFIAGQYGDRIEWREKDKEFSIDGVLYDVARIKRSGGRTFLYCINDKKEKQLLDDLVKAVDKNQDNKRGKNIKPVFPDLVFIDPIGSQQIFSVSSPYNFLNITLVSSYEEVNSPPPKV
jgi:hypothetical protein